MLPPFPQRILACVLAAFLAAPMAAQASAWGEYETKAAFIAILMGYITWPPPKAQDPSRTFTLVVLGISPFEDHLERAFARTRRNARIVKVRNLTPTLLSEADALFVASSEVDRLEEILRICRGRPILLLGDTPEYCRQGIMVNLIIQDGKIRSEANLLVTRQARLEISSAFLAAVKPRIIEAP